MFYYESISSKMCGNMYLVEIHNSASLVSNLIYIKPWKLPVLAPEKLGIIFFDYSQVKKLKL